MSKYWRSSYLAAALALVVASGCAEQREPRSFVQPNVIKKADLDGSYYYVQTVVDAPPTQGALFAGAMSDLQKIKFDVQENHLYIRRAYEHVLGSEDSHGADPKGYKGQILAAYRITSHFDIIRDFNSTTGEQTNRIIESTERPWYQREFFRVDWSQNLVTDYSGLDLFLTFADNHTHVTPVSYWQSDPTHPDALHMERNRNAAHPEGFGSDEMVYLDITNQMVISPEEKTACYEEGGKQTCFTFPACFFYNADEDCANQKVKIRHAFAKVPPQCADVGFAKDARCHDYQPRVWSGKQMDLFGVWDVNLRRLTYDRDYGITNSGFVRHAARFNLWKRSYEGKDGKGNGIPIPYDKREIRQKPYYADGSMPIVYKDHPIYPDGYVDQVYPPALWDDFREVLRQWDIAFRVAASDLTGKKESRKQLEAIALKDYQFKIVIPCHNPVRFEAADGHAADPEICREGLVAELDKDGQEVKDKQGNPILRARQGDPRHSRIFWVHQPQKGPLGYGPGLYDLETGETQSGQAYIYGAAVDSYAARSRDLMLLLNGDLLAEDFANGVNIQEAVLNRKMNGTNTIPNQQTTFKYGDVVAMTQAMDFDFAKAFTPDNGYPPLDTRSAKSIRESLKWREDAIYKGYYEHRINDRASKLGRLIGSPLEKLMITPDLMAVSGVSPAKRWEQLSSNEKMLVSPLRRQAMMAELEKKRIKAEAVGVDFADFDEVGLRHTLKRYTDKYGESLADKKDEILKQMRHEIYVGVTLHEVGHNVGCRHNFRGSYDAINYFPRYWQLRTEALDNPDKGMSPSDGQLHARWNNIAGGKETRYEIENGIREHQYSSIMDYGSEWNADLAGLGYYDHALIKFSYAEHVEVFTNAKSDEKSLATFGALHIFSGAMGFPSALTQESGLNAISYTSYPSLFNDGWEGLGEREDVPFSEITEQSIGNSQNTLMGDSQGRPMVPYYFCSDEFAGNLTCQRFDSGADSYEQAADLISRYHNFYLVNTFKRDRYTFKTSLGYLERIGGRYFNLLRQQLTWYALLRTELESYLHDIAQLGFGGDPNKVSEAAAKFFSDEKQWGSFTVGVNLGFEMLGKVITTPSAGWFISYARPDNPQLKIWKQWRDNLGNTGDPRVPTVGLLEGKFHDTTWDFDGCGYYWAEECQTRIGYLVDKQVALDYLTQSQAYFTGRDTNADVRRYSIGYFLPYKKQLTEKFGAIISEDILAMAPYFADVQKTRVAQPGWVFDKPGMREDDPTQVKTEVIDPSLGFTMALHTGLFALSSFPSTFDHDIIDQTQIFVLGNGEASVTDEVIQTRGTTDPAQLVSRGGNKEWLLFTEPNSGKTFAAHATSPARGLVLDPTTGNKTTTPLRTDTAVRMLEQMHKFAKGLADANALANNDPSKPAKVANAQLEYDKFRQNLEVMRSLHKAFGYGPYKTDAPFYF